MRNYKFVFIAIIVAYFIASIIYGFVFPNDNMLIYSPIIEILFFALPVLFIAKYVTTNDVLEKPSIKNRLKFNFHFDVSVIPLILWGLLGILLAEGGINIILLNFLPESFKDMLTSFAEIQHKMCINNSNTFWEFTKISFCIAVIPAVCEEILFRGYLLQNIAIRNSSTLAVVWSAMCFALVHIHPIGLIPIFIVGLYLGSLFIATGSIIPSIILHFLNNFLVVIVANYGMEKFNFDAHIDIIWGLILFLIGGILMLITIRKVKHR